MKQLLLICLLGSLFNLAPAQIIIKQEVPATLRDGFNKQYLHVKHATWTFLPETIRVSFEASHKKYVIEYDHTGKALDQTVQISRVEIPPDIRIKLERNYGDFIIESVSRIDSERGSIYETQVARSEEGYRLLFTLQGNLLEVVTIDEVLAQK
jgi:hypothetical protein